MLVSELKKIVEPTTVLGRGFAPITEYFYVCDKSIKSTNMEAFIELEAENPMPFSGCILTEKLSKFLTSMDKDVDLTFTSTENVLTISYGKKNKFAIPMESLKDFPDSPSTKYNGADLLCSINLTEDFMKMLENASKFISITDVTFNGVYLKKNKLYSTNREIIYVGNVDSNYENSIFIPYNFIKLLTKFKKTFNILEVYSCGFKATGFGSTLYYANYEDKTMADFDKVILGHKDFLQINVTDELKNSVNRVSLFDEIVNIHMKNNIINIVTNNISETIDTDIVCNGEYSFKFNTAHLKKLVDYKTISFTKRKDETVPISAIKGIDDNSITLCAIVE